MNKVVFNDYSDLTLQLLREWRNCNAVTLVTDFDTLVKVMKPFLYNKGITVGTIELYGCFPYTLYVMTICLDGELIVYPYEEDMLFSDELVYVHIKNLDAVLNVVTGDDVTFIPYRYKDDTDMDAAPMCEDCDETECEQHPWHRQYHKSEVMDRKDHGKDGINISTYDEDIDEDGPTYTVNYMKTGEGGYESISYSSNQKFDKNEIEKLLRQWI